MVFTHGLLDPTSSGDVFVQVSVTAGIGASVGAPPTITKGWVGSPDPSDTPQDPWINSFVGGFTESGGAGITINVGGIGVGYGFNAVYSPKASPLNAGEEVNIGANGQVEFNAKVSAGITFSYAVALPIPSRDLPVAVEIYKSFSSATPGQTTLNKDSNFVTQIANDLGPVLGTAVVAALTHLA